MSCHITGLSLGAVHTYVDDKFCLEHYKSKGSLEEKDKSDESKLSLDE